MYPIRDVEILQVYADARKTKENMSKQLQDVWPGDMSQAAQMLWDSIWREAHTAWINLRLLEDLELTALAKIVHQPMPNVLASDPRWHAFVTASNAAADKLYAVALTLPLEKKANG
jgi:hypothetical protein